eukprot:gene12536-14715_t
MDSTFVTMDIQEIKIETKALEATLSFYTELLGLELLYKSKERICISAGTSVLTFIKSKGPEHPVYHIAFNIPPGQLQQSIDWLHGKADLLPVTESNVVAAFENWNANAVYFLDNNGNLLEFIARHDLSVASDEPFSGHSILCISEIGVVTEQVPQLANRLMSTYGLPVFSKQPRADNFTALGDDSGLLILVENRRNWFPTKIPAEKFPLSILIREGLLSRELLF